MIDPYRSEVDPPILPLRVYAKGPPVRRVQEWLGLHGLGAAIDGDFGPATQRAVSNFQRSTAGPVTPANCVRSTLAAGAAGGSAHPARP